MSVDVQAQQGRAADPESWAAVSVGLVRGTLSHFGKLVGAKAADAGAPGDGGGGGIMAPAARPNGF